MEGNFEASVLLLDTVWDISLAKHVNGNFVAAIPARDVLAFGDSTSPEAIAELRDVIKRLKSKRGRPPNLGLSLSPRQPCLAATSLIKRRNVLQTSEYNP
jgi:hypothetical protein